MTMHTIDGSQGEGGGQILRTALALAGVTGTPVRIERIRARRPKPGLQRQHLMAVQAAAAVCGGRLEGDALHSQEVVLHPGRPVAGDYRFDIGSAGSATLVLQTVLPVLLAAAGPSTVTIRGGTHNPLAPPAEFLCHAFLPVLARLGLAVDVALERHGFMPAGGGVLRAAISPGRTRTPLDLRDRGKALGRSATILHAHLPSHVAHREAQALKHALRWSHAEITTVEVPSDGPGNALLIRLDFAEVSCVVTSCGELRKPAEAVAAAAARQVQRYLEREVPVDEHLADQLLLPLALGAGGCFRTGPLSEHTRTNAAVINAILGPVVTWTEGGSEVLVQVAGRGA